MVSNNYSFLKKIGQGSYGEVWLVRHKEVEHKKFVLKKISFHKASSREMEAARQECQLLKSLEHPNIVQYKDSFEENNSLYIAMAYCEEGDLYTCLKERKGLFLSEKQIIEWLIQITMALSYIHERNILHRDLKTQNVFLAKSVIKIGDLGIAKQLETKNDMAKTIIGTPYYMSPELFSKQPYNFKSDIWSLGCVAYEMCTLKHAFNAKNYTSLSYKILNGKTPDMPSMYSKDLINLIKDMLNKNPSERPAAIKILTDQYIRRHIKMFVDSSKSKPREHRRPSSRNRSHNGCGDSEDISNVISNISDNKSHNNNNYNDNERKLSAAAPYKSKIEIKHSISTEPNEHNNCDYDDNADVVIVRSSNESNSKKSSSSSSHKEDDIHSGKSSKTDMEKELEKVSKEGHFENEIPKEQIDDKFIEPSNISQIKIKDTEGKSARQRRRQKKRDQGLRTLMVENVDSDDVKLADNSHENRNPRRRKKDNFSKKDEKKYVLPELRRIEITENLDNESPNDDILQVMEKMSETLTFVGVPGFSKIKDSMLLYKERVDPIFDGPIENEQETLDRTKLQNLRYQDIRKEVMKNIGWEKMGKCYDILRNLELNHEIEVKDILGNDFDGYFGKILWLKMIEEG